ncbi:MAG: hypothetical protein EBX50_12685 [Chitinophagia bacterium]|nr:hypothetical protein [Chitinophagia bacterium]
MQTMSTFTERYKMDKKQKKYKQTEMYNKEHYRSVFVRIKKNAEHLQMLDRVTKDFGSTNNAFVSLMEEYCKN